MKALIAGAGIAGLATGIALRQAGFDVEVFERSSELREIGAGLMIWPNGSRSLKALGVTIKAQSITRLSVCSWRGRLVNDYPLSAIAERYDSEITFVHRAELQTALANRFGRDGLHLGAGVSGFNEKAAGVEIILRDGSVAEGGAVVGADGLRSSVRSQLLSDGDPIYLGSTIWRGVADGRGLPFPNEAVVNWVGRGSEFIAAPLVDGRVYWAGVTKEPRGEKPGPRGHRGDLDQRFSSWVQPIPALIAATEEGAILRNDMYDRARVRRWSAGRVTLVGDAAHPMTPNSGQGACQALEDAVALGDSLHRAPNLTEAFGMYERRRLKRANRVVAMSRQGTRATQFENPVLCALRDSVAGLVAGRLFLRTMDAVLAESPPPAAIAGEVHL